ncbi:MAG: protein kinase [Gemmatimonadaceae bacterium]|nr:protein kinase [Gemmatimonadaceae bacterium]
MSTFPIDLLASALESRYVVVRELGQGGMATVYLAHDIKHERDVAIKVLHPELGAALGADRFLSEIKTTARLQHPHILPLLDSGAADGLLYYVMPLVTGETLRARLERETQLPVDDALRIACDVAEALAEAHTRGVIHRDIKPENILLQAGRAVVADFGIALAVQQAGGQRMTQTGLSLGTPQYMAPEQAMGERTIDARADFYALGAVTYEMLVGDPPFIGATVQAIVARVLTERPVSPRAVRDTVPLHVERAVLKALAKLPADRFASAGAFAEAMSGARVLDADDVGSTAASTSRAMSTRSVRVWQASAVVLGVIAVAAVANTLRPARGDVPSALQQFDLALPDSVRLFKGPGRKLAMTRDGSRMAFVGSRAGTTGLYVRDLSASQARLVKGSEGALSGTSGVSPDFSPDGEWLLYNDDIGLRRVPVRGGASQMVVDSGATGVWADDGAILYVWHNSVWRMLPGGRPMKLAAHSSARGVRGYLWLHPLPGGKHALVTIDHSTVALILDSLTIGVLDIGNGRVTDLGLRGTNAKYVAPGFMVFGQTGGRVAAVPFSLRDLKVNGAPTVVLENVWQGGGGAMGFAVADNGLLLYHATRADDVSGNRLVAVGGNGVDRQLPGGAVLGAFPRAAPDGKRILLNNGIDVNSGLTVIDAESGAHDVLVTVGDGMRGEWSRDGRRVVFLRQTAQTMDIVSRAVDRGSPDIVLGRDSTRIMSSISLGPADGWAAFGGDVRRFSGDGDVLIAPMNSLSAVRPFVASPAREWSPSVSPDGRFVAYASDESGSFQIYVTPLPGPGGRMRVSIGGGTEPHWSADGSMVYFRSADRFVRALLDDTRQSVRRRDQLLPDHYDRSSIGSRSWDLLPNGDFLMIAVPASSERLQAVVQWQTLLRKAAP